MAKTAAELGVPEIFNAATHFVDRHIHEGRGSTVAIECGDERVTYAELHERVNRFGSALRRHCEVRPEERVALLLLDGPEFAYAFFGAIKIGAVPIPTNTLWKAADYRYLLNDSGARVLIVSEELLPEFEKIPRRDLRALKHVVVVDRTRVELERWLADAPAELDAEPVSRDAPAFWLYSSGSTGAPKGCVHLQHDMVVCAELFGKGVLGIRPDDRCFSVAKLFFAYGLGNALYFPLAVGATSILWPGPPAPANVYAVIAKHRPTLFFSVPTGYGMLLSHEGEFDLSSIRLAVSAGEALPPALYERFKRRFGVDIIDGIGSTEALHMFISNQPGDIRPGSSGRVVPGYQARIVDDRRRAGRAGRDRQPLDQRRFDVRRLLESAREDQAHDRRRVASNGRQVLTGSRRLLLVRRPLRRHAEGRRVVGEPGGGGERARGTPGGAGVRCRGARGSRHARQAGGLRRAEGGPGGLTGSCG